MGSGGKSQRGLFVELTLSFGDPALDEEDKTQKALDEENYRDESGNDEISSLSGQFF